MPDPGATTGMETRSDRAESARLDNFVDGAFAFAITLLVISGASLPRNVAALEHALRGIPAFAACFAQLAIFWHGHVRWRDTVQLADGTGLRLSLLLVFFALIFVFPLHLVYAGIGLVSALIAVVARATDAGWLIAAAGFSYALLGFTHGIANRYRARMERGAVP